MKIISLTNQADSGIVRVTKGFQALLFASTVNTSAIDGATIDITIERANGDNIDIARNYELMPFIALSNFGESVGVKRDAESLYYYMCPIADGNILLDENDSIKIELKGLPVGDTTNPKYFNVYTVEVPTFANTVHVFDEKVFLSDEKNKVFSVDGNDVIMLDNTTKLREVVFKYENGISTKHDFKEIESISNDVDNLAVITTAGVQTMYKAETLVVPTVGVETIELTKITGLVHVYMLNTD